jgi:5-carboxymethyl-2-hydroxymuconate isomerase
MPHIHLEYSANLDRPQPLDPQPLLAAINDACVGSGLFEEADVKSRVGACEHFRVGTEPSGRGFVHVRIALLAGRSAEQRQALAAAVLAAAQANLAVPSGLTVQLSVETTELDRPSYAKAVLHG